MLLQYENNKIEVGCDEAGRGCLVGPVVAAAVILPKDFDNYEINDSKKLTAKKRNELRKIIEENALDYAIGIVDENTIDQINILNASILAMHIAIDNLKLKFDSIIVDGNKFNKYKDYNHKCIVKGDNKYLNIASASIIAKTYRDDIMLNLHNEIPFYDWDKNKGYGTKYHIAAIEKYGFSKYQRKSFILKPKII